MTIFQNKYKLIAYILLTLNIGWLLFHLLVRRHHHPPDLGKMLQFDTEQQTKYVELRKQHRAKFEAAMDTDRQLHDSLFALLKQAPDSAKVADLTLRIGQIKTKNEQALFYHLKDVQQLCNAAQKKVFEEKIKDITRGFMRHKPPPPPH